MADTAQRALDWAATGAAGVAVVGSLVVFEAVQRVAMRFGEPSHQRAVTGMARWVNTSLRLTGAKLHASGREHVDPSRNYIVVANHQSMFDISLLTEFLAPLRPRYVSKRELGRGVPGISYNLTRGGSALIDRKNAAQAHAELEKLARHVHSDGWTAVIFPEGTRSKTGGMKPFREAGLRTLVANAPGVPVLPITTSGGSRFFAHNLKPAVRNVPLELTIHAPVRAPDPADTTAFTAFVKSLEETIRSALPMIDAAATEPSRADSR